MIDERIQRDLERLVKAQEKMGELSFPPFIDSSNRATLAECGQKFNYGVLQKLTPRQQSVHLVFGSAFAKGLEIARRRFFDGGLDSATAQHLALEAIFSSWGAYEPAWGEPGEQAKTLDSCVQAMQFYFERWPLDSDVVRPLKTEKGHAVEFTFAMPIPEVIHPETGNPMLYVGRFDMLADLEGTLLVEDDKTTSQLGQGWARRWELRSQFTGYCAAATHYGYNVAGALIRGVAIYKTKFEGAQAITYRPQWQIDRWYHQLVRDLNHAILQWKSGVWDYNLDDACSSYGGCPFLELCNKQQPELWIEGNFVHNDWNPLARD